MALAEQNQVTQPSRWGTIQPYVDRGMDQASRSQGYSGLLGGIGQGAGAFLGSWLGSSAAAAPTAATAANAAMGIAPAAGGAGAAGALAGAGLGAAVGGLALAAGGALLDSWEQSQRQMEMEDALERAENEARRWRELEYQASQRAEGRAQEVHDLNVTNTKRSMQQAALMAIIGQRQRIAAARGLATIPSGVAASGGIYGAQR